MSNMVSGQASRPLPLEIDQHDIMGSTLETSNGLHLYTLVALFSSRDAAEHAARSLRDRGYYGEEISLVSFADKDQLSPNVDLPINDTVADGSLAGAAVGAATGLLLGAGLFMIPGVGPLFIAGPLITVLSSITVGGIAGGLIDYGIPADQREYLQNRVTAGSTLAVIRTIPEKAESLRQLLQEEQALEVQIHISTNAKSCSVNK